MSEENKKAIRVLLAEHGDTYEDLASVIGCTVSTVSDKVNGNTKNGFTQPEMLKIKEHYNLTAKDMDRIFFGK